jgi:UDP-N-acetylmuramyl pentapeptide phosphotransferase/UDP-N-acetylglucosamine-1-phosphate transferase
MLGDAGANALGALVGLATLAALPTATARWVVLSLLLFLNLMSEVVSFSSVIDAVPPLRYLDRLGRRTEPED